MAKDPDAAAARIAAGQLGLITWWQARYRAGLTERQIEWRVATKRWRRVQRGVYVVSGTTGSWSQTLLAAQRCARTQRVVETKNATRLEEVDDVVACGKSALWLRGCRRPGRPDEHELLTSRRRPPVVKGALIRRTADLPDHDVEAVDGVPSLAVPRLLVDLATQVDETQVTAVTDDLLGGADAALREQVHARALQLCGGRSGVRRLVDITAPGAESRFASWLERHSAALFTAALLPPPQWNIELRDGSGRIIGIGDAVWPAEKVDVEVDGLRFPSTDAQRRRDRRKDRRLQMAAWLVLRFTWLDILERPDDVVAEVAAALQSGRVRA